MPVVKELIRGEKNGSLSFGDYTLEKKTKKEGFEFDGDLYKVRTFQGITRLSKNGLFVYESVPGTAVQQFAVSEDGVTFQVEGDKDCEITVGLAESTQYVVYFDGKQSGLMETNRSGKLSVGIVMEQGKAVEVKIVKR